MNWWHEEGKRDRKNNEAKSSEKRKYNNDAKSSEKRKFLLLPIKYLKGRPESEVLNYIKELHEAFKRKDKKLKKYREKLKSIVNAVRARGHSNNETSVVGEVNVKEETAEIGEVEPLSLVDEIREAAETAQNRNGFLYEPTSGLYYDKTTGYYYNAEMGLYYDGNTGCYYKYDQEKNEFEFHSQVHVPRDDVDKITEFDKVNIQKTENRSRKRKFKKGKDSDSFDEEKEDGEIVSSSNEDYEPTSSRCETNKFEDVAKKYPPSLRIIVQETNLDKIKAGTLYIITYKGGTLGREGEHDVIIPDVNISKYHLKFSYDEEKSLYQCVDFGSRNGTILNGKRMSNAKQESDSLDVVHGSVIQISQTKLLCHIHQGNSTCGLCEPGLVMDQKESNQNVVALSHKQQLKMLQKRYGLENEKYVESKTDAQYNDRAAIRRVKVGSSNEHEKTNMASVNTEISSDNKGFKMLSKLGWTKGESLGKANEGLLEPISVSANQGTTGLGSEGLHPPSSKLSKIEMKRLAVWKKAQQRYDTLPLANIFHDSDSD